MDRDELAGQIGAELAELQAAYDDSDRALAEHLGVGRTDLRCLDLIVRGGPRTAGALATALHLAPGSVTALLDRLERAGYLHRRPDPHHGRRVLVAPTPHLVKIIEPIMARRIHRGRAQLEHYDNNQLALIRDFLHRTRENHRQQSDQLRANSSRQQLT